MDLSTIPDVAKEEARADDFVLAVAKLCKTWGLVIATSHAEHPLIIARYTEELADELLGAAWDRDA